MKNIYEILEDFGLEIPAEKKTDFEKAWKENYRTKSEYDIAVTKRDEYKSSLDTVSEQLKAFDGVDVADLNGQIKKLSLRLIVLRMRWELHLIQSDHLPKI